MPKMYVSKYATTHGVQEVYAKEIVDFRGVFWVDGIYGGLHLGRDIFATRDEANADAAIRVKKKIKSLEKQIEKLKARKNE